MAEVEYKISYKRVARYCTFRLYTVPEQDRIFSFRTESVRVTGQKLKQKVGKRPERVVILPG